MINHLDTGLSPVQAEIAGLVGVAMPSARIPLDDVKMFSETLCKPNTITAEDCHRAAKYLSERMGMTVVFHLDTRAFYGFPSSTPLSVHACEPR